MLYVRVLAGETGLALNVYGDIKSPAGVFQIGCAIVTPEVPLMLSRNDVCGLQAQSFHH